MQLNNLSMELKGKIIQLLAPQTGEGKNGTWKKQEYIIEIPGQYPKKVCFYAWGDTIDNFAIKEGDEVTASIDIESREYNGKWYTNIKAWKVTKEQAQQASVPAAPSDPSSWPTPGDEVKPAAKEDFDDLPF